MPGEADVVVVNTHLYATSLSIKEAELLPPHDLVVFDEAHELEDIVSAAFGFDLSQARLVAAGIVRRVLWSQTYRLPATWKTAQRCLAVPFAHTATLHSCGRSTTTLRRPSAS